MNKNDLAYKLSEEFDLTKKTSVDIINYIFDEITKSMVKGEEVTIVGFGSFSAKQRASTKCVNPQNVKEMLEVPSMHVPKFKPGKPLKDALKK